MNNRSVEPLIELEAILQANSDILKVVVAEKTVPLANEDSAVAVYVNFTNSMPELSSNSIGLEGYDIHSFFVLNINVDCTSDKFRIYDITDSIIRSVLNDTTVWDKLIDRNLITVEYDNAEFYPKRSATLVLEVLHRLMCS